MAFPKTWQTFLDETGDMSRFTGRFFAQGFKPRYEFAEFIRQCFIIGYKSLPLIGLTGFIMGLVLTMQLRPSLIDYGVESQLPAMVGIAIVREIGPVITALIFAGKIGSSIGAELGSMKVTEQIDAMEKQLRDSHRRRLEQGVCTPKADILFVETLRNLERIGDHADNLSISVLRS